MSVARVYTSKRTRKEWTCDKCGDKIPVGGSRRYYSVGFRGFERTRCVKPECMPLMSELESSLVADVYAAQEGVDLSTCNSLEDLQAALQEIADACEDVASQYEDNPMYEINYDLQERADMVRSAGDELSNWDGADLDEEPEEDTDEHDEWLNAARDSAQEAIDGMEL